MVVIYELTPAALTLAGGEAELRARFVDRLSGLAAVQDAPFTIDAHPFGVCIKHADMPGSLIEFKCVSVGGDGSGAVYMLTGWPPAKVRDLLQMPGDATTIVETVRDLIKVWPEVARWNVREPSPETRLERLVERAKEWVIRDQRASSAYLQRRLHIGYSVALQILDCLETQGVISPPDVQGKRAVLVARP